MSLKDPGLPAKRTRGGLIATAAVLLLGLNMAAVAFRAEIARTVPIMAPLYAAVGLPAVPPPLAIAAVETTLTSDASGQVLELDGKITNPGSTQVTVPNLRIVVRDETEQSLYSWTTAAPRPQLGPGEMVDFRSRLVQPPSAGRDVVVSFAGQADGASAAKVKSER